MISSTCGRTLRFAFRGIHREKFDKRCSDICLRFYFGLQTLTGRQTPCDSSRALNSTLNNCNNFSIVSTKFILVNSDSFTRRINRNFFTTKPRLTNEIEEAVGATRDSEVQKDNEKKSTNEKSQPEKGSKMSSTVIEHTVQRESRQNFRHSVGSNKNNPSYSIDVVRKSSQKEIRDLVNSPMNDEKNRNFGGLSSISTFIKPGDEYGSYPVIAIQIARSIDLSKVISQVFAAKGVRKMRERLSVVAQLQPNNTGISATEAARFVAVFGFGSVVFFNVSPKEIAALTEEIKRLSTGSLSSGKERKDRFCVHVEPPTISSMRTGMGIDENKQVEVDVVTADYCIVPELNMKSVDVISNIMAQSVALDAYNDTVDELLVDFERINNKVTSEGNLTPVDRDKMFRAVAQNNAIFLKLTKVGIKDRVDTAWNLSQYENVSEGMREEFDIDRRFENIEFKLNLIQQNAKFFLEVLANQKSDSLEWIIIVLILLECVLMCIEMSGMGEPLFAYLKEFWPTRPSLP